MLLDEEICGTCKWHHKDEMDDWMCVNNNSEYCADWTSYTDSCDDWEPKGKEKRSR